MPQLVPWAAALEQGTRRLFGFLQLDIAGHSSLPGSSEVIRATRSNLHKQVDGTLRPHEAQELTWQGDGGAYLFLLDSGRRVDSMVLGALQVLDSMRLFNSLRSLNRIGTPISLRISCHVGGAIWDPDLSNLYGRDINYFLKSEREIGFENRIALTEEAYSDLEDDELRKLFVRRSTHHQYSVSGRRYERDIYVSHPIDTVIREDYSLQDGDPPVVQEIARHLRGAQSVDLFMAGGDSFFRVFYEALRMVRDDVSPTLVVRVLLRSSSTASSRSAFRFKSLSESHGIKVETRFYDWDFMIRGYSLDEVVYLSYYLREGNILTGRYNPMVKLRRNTSALEDFLIAMFHRVFDACWDWPNDDSATLIEE